MDRSITLTRSFQWLFLLFLLIFAFIASAQITVTHDDMPVPGMVIMRSMDTVNITEPGGAGLNQTWDFRSAVTHLSDTVNYENPSEVPGGDLFPAANLAEGRTIFDPSGDFYNYIFWNSAEDGMYAIGWNLFFGNPAFSFNSIQYYEPVPNTLPLPLNYGDSQTTTSTGTRYSSTWMENIQIDSSMIVSHINLVMTVDGSGTLMTPAGTYPALRVMEVSTHQDSSWVWTQAGGWEFERTQTYTLTNYKWYTNLLGEVATLSLDGESTDFQFLSSVIIDVANLNFSSNINVFPNPAGELLYIKTRQAGKQGRYIFNKWHTLTECHRP